jgi:hypothetical protein
MMSISGMMTIRERRLGMGDGIFKVTWIYLTAKNKEHDSWDWIYIDQPPRELEDILARTILPHPGPLPQGEGE